MYKLWLIRLLYFWSYTSINKFKPDNPFVYDFFSITYSRGSGKHGWIEMMTASHHTHTNIYTFGNNRFIKMDDMLNHILNN